LPCFLQAELLFQEGKYKASHLPEYLFKRQSLTIPQDLLAHCSFRHGFRYLKGREELISSQPGEGFIGSAMSFFRCRDSLDVFYENFSERGRIEVNDVVKFN